MRKTFSVNFWPLYTCAHMDMDNRNTGIYTQKEQSLEKGENGSVVSLDDV